jgi:hypothetical protein
MSDRGDWDGLDRRRKWRLSREDPPRPARARLLTVVWLALAVLLGWELGTLLLRALKLHHL